MGSSFKQGIDTKDIKYELLLTKSKTRTDEIQFKGRGRRRCGTRFEMEPIKNEWIGFIFTFYLKTNTKFNFHNNSTLDLEFLDDFFGKKHEITLPEHENEEESSSQETEEEEPNIYEEEENEEEGNLYENEPEEEEFDISKKEFLEEETEEQEELIEQTRKKENKKLKEKEKQLEEETQLEEESLTEKNIQEDQIFPYIEYVKNKKYSSENKKTKEQYNEQEMEVYYENETLNEGIIQPFQIWKWLKIGPQQQLQLKKMEYLFKNESIDNIKKTNQPPGSFTGFTIFTEKNKEFDIFRNQGKDIKDENYLSKLFIKKDPEQVSDVIKNIFNIKVENYYFTNNDLETIFKEILKKK